jgi:hypothetical protein
MSWSRTLSLAPPLDCLDQARADKLSVNSHIGNGRVRSQAATVAAQKFDGGDQYPYFQGTRTTISISTLNSGL